MSSENARAVLRVSRPERAGIIGLIVAIVIAVLILRFAGIL